MDWQTHVIFAAKLLKVCNCDEGAAIYSNLPAIDSKPAHFHRLYAHILENQPRLLDAAIEIFTGKDMGADKNSYEYKRLKEEEATFRELAEKAKEIIGSDGITKISSDKISAALSLISHIYFDTFNNPVQAFLPNSSLCSAQWDFWDSIDYLKFRDEFYTDSVIIPFRKKMANSSVWTEKPDIKVFPKDIRERLLRENAFDKPFNPKAMIKAMIIRLGEMAKPAINYEIVDHSIRKFLRYLEIDEYLRVDREIEFLRRLESEIARAITDIVGTK